MEGVAKDGLLGESSPSGYLADADVCNICITSQLAVVCPGIGRNANGALEVPQDQFAVGGKNQVLRILYNADKRRQLFVSQRDHRIDAHGPPRRKVAGENACHKH